MSNNNDVLKTLVFLALTAFLVGAVAATVVAFASQADAQQSSPNCPAKSPAGSGKPVLQIPPGCGPSR